MNSSDTSTDSLWEQIKQVLREFFRGSRERVSGLAVTIDRQASIRKLAAQIGLLRRERLPCALFEHLDELQALAAEFSAPSGSAGG